MAGNGYVGPMGRYLSVSFEDKNWHIMFRCINNKPCDDFMNYNGIDVNQSDVEKFIPNWNSLEWHSSNLFKSKGLSARDGKFDIKILTNEDSSLSNEQILKEFTEFMSEIGRVTRCKE